MVVEEVINDLSTGKLRYFNIHLSPLRDDNGNVIGVYGISSEITIQKEEEHRRGKRQILKHFQNIADIIPAPFYWFDLNLKCLGANKKTFEAIGMKFSPEKYIGHTVYNIYPKETADQITRNQRYVLETHKTITTEESINDIATGKKRYFNVTLAPFRDDKNIVIGMYGVSSEVTAEKEAEQLRLQQTVHEAELAQQAKFKAIASQAVHDIRSPLLSMIMILKACDDLAPERRLALQHVASSITSIAENLLGHWEANGDDQMLTHESAQQESVLVALVLTKLIDSKRFQYHNTGINLALQVDPNHYFACMMAHPSLLERIVSNLINNAVDACEASTSSAHSKKQNVITVGLTVNDGQLILTVADEGKGIPPAVLAKIRERISVTSGKKDGHGLGMMQVQETVEAFHGTFTIDSSEGKGTTVTLSFPVIDPPAWLATTLTIKPDDTLIVLDDEQTIHDAWRARFKACGLRNKVIYLQDGQEAVDTIKNVPNSQSLFLLTDYELLHQSLNGLDVLEQTGCKRAVLVTSHDAEADIQERALKLGVKILPKHVASEVPVIISDASDAVEAGPVAEPVEASQSELPETSRVEPAEASSDCKTVIIDDHVVLTEALLWNIDGPNEPDVYHDPNVFLQNLGKYRKDTIILTDYYLSDQWTGLQLAEKLHKAGFTDLYIMSGKSFPAGYFPAYVQFLSKTKVDALLEKLNG